MLRRLSQELGSGVVSCLPHPCTPYISAYPCSHAHFSLSIPGQVIATAAPCRSEQFFTHPTSGSVCLLSNLSSHPHLPSQRLSSPKFHPNRVWLLHYLPNAVTQNANIFHALSLASISTSPPNPLCERGPQTYCSALQSQVGRQHEVELAMAELERAQERLVALEREKEHLEHTAAERHHAPNARQGPGTCTFSLPCMLCSARARSGHCTCAFWMAPIS